MTNSRKYTDEEREFIKNNVKGMSRKELTELFNKEFNADLSASAINSYLSNHKLTSGLNTRFSKGINPWNKGTKGVMKPNKTSFKPGHDNKFKEKPVGTERIDKGFVMIKVDGYSRYQIKAKMIWEEHNGKVPDGKIIKYLDGNPLNVSIENLALISRGENLIINHQLGTFENPEMTKAAIGIARLKTKVKELNLGETG